MFITLRSSIAQRIQHSQVFAERFRSNIELVDSEVGMVGRIGNLRAAKHRHESQQKPLGRSVLYCKALLLTAEQVAKERKSGEEGRDCLRFFDDLTEEHLLQLAMMADLSDEVIILIRFNDNEDTDVTTLKDECMSFVERARVLVEDARIFELGYTKYMLELLSKPLVFFPGGVAKSFGGPGRPSREVRVRTLARMKNWFSHSPQHDASLRVEVCDVDVQNGQAQGATGQRADCDDA